MKKIFIIVCMTIPILIAGCGQIPSVETPKKNITKVGNTIIAQGRWKRIEDTSTSKYFPKNNFTKIYCDKETMTYHEEIACLIMPKEDKYVKKGSLYPITYDYQITEWTPDDTITIVDHAPVADIQITISLKDKFAERRWRETKSRGSDTADAKIHAEYALE